MKKTTVLVSIVCVIIMFINVLLSASPQYKRSKYAIHKGPVKITKPLKLAPDFIIKNVRYNTILRCYDPLIVISSEVWNIGNIDYKPGLKKAIYYVDIADSANNNCIYFGGCFLNKVINKGSFQRIKFTYKYSDIMFKDALKKAKKIKIMLFADEQGEIPELNEMNNIYRSKRDIINNCKFFNYPRLKAKPGIKKK